MPELPPLGGLPFVPGLEMPRWAPVVLGWLLTYLAHSTLLIGLAWLASRLPRIGEETRDLLWKCALVGGIATATAQTAGSAWLPAAELRVLEPKRFEMRLEASAAGGGLPGILSPDGLPMTGPRAPLPGVPDSVLQELARRVAARRAELGPAERVEITSTRKAGATYEQVRLVGRRLPPPEIRMLRTTEAASRVVFFGATARSWVPLLLAVWGAVALLLLLRLGIGHLSLARLLHARRPVADPALGHALREIAGADAERIRLTASEALSTPVALSGWEICLPGRALAELPPAEQRGILAHEAAHLVRRDPAWLLAARVIEAVLFVQPLNVLARRRLQEASEFLCDEWAVRRTGEPLALARCLASVAGWIAPESSPQLAAAMVERGGSPLVRRVRRILDSRERAGAPRRGAVGLAIAGAALLVAGTPRIAVGSGATLDRLFLRLPADSGPVRRQTSEQIGQPLAASPGATERRMVRLIVVERAAGPGALTRDGGRAEELR